MSLQLTIEAGFNRETDSCDTVATIAPIKISKVLGGTI